MGRRWQLAAATGVILLSVGCAAAAGESEGPLATVPATSPTASPAPSIPATSTGTPAAPSTRPGTVPPAATIAAEGGDPVTGQLGTYSWEGGGSDSPWLPGAPITVGAAEPLTVRLERDPPIASWTARRTRGDATSDIAAVPVGDGSGPIVFPAPGPGEWTIAVEVRFAGGGSAAYAWHLTVR